jgi:hypothetical protein
MQLAYQPAADRLLWQVRTGDGQLYAVWLTRRMVRLLWQPLGNLVTNASLLQEMPHASVLPQARDMLAETLRHRPLPGASFDQPFDTRVTARPLGTEPLLPEAIDLGPGPGGQGLKLQVREGNGGRSITVQLSADLAAALQRLVEQAVAASDWGLQIGTPDADAAGPTGAQRPTVLN